MEVTIGIQNSPRELNVETDSDAAALTAAVQKAVADDGVLAITDTKGATLIIPARSLGYLQVGGQEKGRVGFGAV